MMDISVHTCVQTSIVVSKNNDKQTEIIIFNILNIKGVHKNQLLSFFLQY